MTPLRKNTACHSTDIESIRAALSSISTGDNTHRQRIAAALKSELGEVGRPFVLNGIKIG